MIGLVYDAHDDPFFILPVSGLVAANIMPVLVIFPHRVAH